MQAPEKPPGLLKTIGKGALYTGLAAAALTAVVLAFPAMGLGISLGTFLSGWGTLLAGHASLMLTIAGAGAVLGGAWKGVEEVATRRMESIQRKAKETRLAKEARAEQQRKPAQDYTKLYEASGIEPGGNMAEKEMQRSRTAAARGV